MALTLVAPPRILFKVHKNGSPLVWPVSERYGIVSFENPNHALYVAMVTESHYKTHKEWPQSVEFSYRKEIVPTILGVRQTTHDELSSLCARWNLHLIVVNDIQSIANNKFAFDGNIETFILDGSARINHLNSLLWDPGFSV